MKRLFTTVKRGCRACAGFFNRYINGTKGVISLFLALLMVPFVSVAGALVNAARINSAIAVFDEALCNASNSTLGTYDEFLKNRFGLLAMSQNTAAGGSGYTPQALIQDTFEYYMEQNIQALSNTYQETDVTAAGIYPLSDTSVLLTQVLEYGKYVVPAKMVIDGFCLDDILSKLTSDLNIVSKFLKTFSSGMDTDMKFDETAESITDAKDKIEASNTAYETYESQYTTFSNSVTAYNDLLDEMAEEIQKAQEEADNAAEEDREEAQKKVQQKRDEYNTKLANKRTEVASNKTNYVSDITAYAEAVKATGDAVIELKTNLAGLIGSAADLAGNVIGTAYALEGEIDDKHLKDLKEQRDAAEKKGDNKTVAKLDADIAKAEKAKREQSLQSDGANAAKEAVKSGQASVEEFIKNTNTEVYQEIYASVIELRNKVRDQYTIPTGNSKMAETEGYFKEFSTPVTVSDIEELEEGMYQEVVSASFFALMKSLVAFIKALISIEFWYAWELTGSMSSGAYSDIGGLPSQKDRTQYPLTSEFAEEDSERSDYYKEVIGAYSNNPGGEGSVSLFQDVVDNIEADINTISDSLGSMAWNNFLSKLGSIWNALKDIVYQLGRLVVAIIQAIAEYVFQKALLVGYIGYNTANRTTYSSSPLTGGSYALATEQNEETFGLSGKAFRGAETEYIMIGYESEKENQKKLFQIIYIMRAVMDALFVLVNPEVAEIAAAAGSATFGIGTVLVYIAYLLGEPMADTLILVNGEDVPLFKFTLFTTPSGVPSLIEKFLHTGLDRANKEKIYDKLSPLATDGGNSSVPKDYASAEKKGWTESPTDVLSIDYTKSLMLVMMLFMNSETLLGRLSDIVQMEAMVNARINQIDTYTFDLDKSFTYLRAAGSFSANEFIRLQKTDIASSKRVVYRGY